MFDYQVDQVLYSKIATKQTYDFVENYVNRWMKIKGTRQVILDVKRDQLCETLDYFTHLIEIGSLAVIRNCNLLIYPDLKEVIFHVSIIINFTIASILNEIDPTACDGKFLFNPESVKILMGRTYKIFLENEVNERFIFGAVHVFLNEPIGGE
jgi:hypothetical protein